MTSWYEQPYPKNPNPPQVTLPRTLYPPKSGKGFFTGADVIAYKRAVSRLGRWPWDPAGWDDGYSDTFGFGSGGNVVNTGVKGVQRQSGIDQTGILGKNTFELLRTVLIPAELPNGGQPAFDQTALNLLKEYAPPSAGGKVPDLGPMYQGGKAMLKQDCTHITGGLPDYPAYDDCFIAGQAIIAPEGLVVTRQSSASPGDAFYADGDSGLHYWFGHLTSSPPNGKRFSKGQTMSYVLQQNQGGGSHVHVGIDARDLIGKPLESHTNYTHGAPLIGDQLTAALT